MKQPIIHQRKSHERGHADHGWLNSYHSFSFGDYFDPQHHSFHALRVINEDRVAPEMGFGMHPHRDMEIISYVIEGSLRHEDSLGNSATMNAGEVQRIRAGSGIRHSEFNPSTSDPVHFLQIWIQPDQKGVTPHYEQKSFAHLSHDSLHLIASKTGRENSISIHQEADLYVGKFSPSKTMTYPVSKNHAIWIQLISGELLIDSHRLQTGDALSLENIETVNIQSTQSSHFLLFDLQSPTT